MLAAHAMSSEMKKYDESNFKMEKRDSERSKGGVNYLAAGYFVLNVTRSDNRKIATTVSTENGNKFKNEVELGSPSDSVDTSTRQTDSLGAIVGTVFHAQRSAGLPRGRRRERHAYGATCFAGQRGAAG